MLNVYKIPATEHQVDDSLGNISLGNIVLEIFRICLPNIT